VFLYYRKFAMSSYCNKIAVTCFGSGRLPRFHFLELLLGSEMTGQEMRHSALQRCLLHVNPLRTEFLLNKI
jgi:hypothetical protein